MTVFNYAITYLFFCVIPALFIARNGWCSLNEQHSMFCFFLVHTMAPCPLYFVLFKSRSETDDNCSIISLCTNEQVLAFPSRFVASVCNLLKSTFGIVSGCVISVLCKAGEVTSQIFCGGEALGCEQLDRNLWIHLTDVCRLSKQRSWWQRWIVLYRSQYEEMGDYSPEILADTGGIMT